MQEGVDLPIAKKVDLTLLARLGAFGRRRQVEWALPQALSPKLLAQALASS